MADFTRIATITIGLSFALAYTIVLFTEPNPKTLSCADKYGVGYKEAEIDGRTKACVKILNDH